MGYPIKFLLMPLIFSLMVGCAKEQPEKVAQDFLNHVEKGELEKAGKLGTKKTEQLLTMMASTGLKDSLQQPDYIEFRNLSCEIRNDTAVCNYTAVRRGTEGPAEETLELVRQEEGWRVHMAKDEMDKDRAR